MNSNVASAAAAAMAAGSLLYYSPLARTDAPNAIAARWKFGDCPIIVVVDIGSSSIRASCLALYEDDYKQVDGSMQQRHAASIDENGHADMQKLAADTEDLLDKVLDYARAAGLADQIVGVGFSTFAMNILGIDNNGEAATPVYTYAGRNSSTAEYAKQLKQQLQDQGSLDEFNNRTGTVIHPAYAPANFLRLHREDKDAIDRVAKWQSISGFLLNKWLRQDDSSTVGVPMSYSEASWTGLFDFRKCEWYAPMLDLIEMDKDKMPSLADSSTPFKGLRSNYEKRWPELSNVPFFLGIGDGAAANIGSKCMDSTRIAVTVGTSAALRVVLDDHVLESANVPEGLWCYRIGKKQLLLGGALSDGGSVYSFMRNLTQLSDAGKIEEELQKLKPTAHNLTILPFLSGERAPGWVEDATCTISGLTKWTTPIELLRAGMESIALRMGALFSLVSPYAEKDVTIVASGAALSSSAAWRQMMADCLGHKVMLENSSTEATSRGVAAFLGSYLGLETLKRSEELDHEGSGCLEVSEPNDEAHKEYLKARTGQDDLYKKLYH